MGIAEGHAVTFSAGLAKAGMKPFVAVYSTFLQRAYDEIMEDVCLQKLPVVFCIDRAGIVGADGETHHGIFDLSYLKHMPNLTVMAPKDGRELEAMMEFAAEAEGPCAIRYPRGEAENFGTDSVIEAGRAEVIREGKDTEIWAIGAMVKKALDAADILEDKGISAGVVNMRFLKPFDLSLLRGSADRFKLIFTLEDNVVSGGAGEEINNLLSDKDVKVLNIGWPDKFIEHGSCEELYEKYGMDANSIAERIAEKFER